MIYIQNQIDYNILIDKKSNGKINPWKEKKIRSLLLSDSYQRIGNNKKSQRVKSCGDVLTFKKLEDEFKLHQANFCKVRLCPMCAWRRSLKIYGQVSKIMDVLTKNENYQYLFLTLTVKNCIDKELSQIIDNLIAAFKELNRSKEFKAAVKGYFRALEITHNLNSQSKSFDTYHPHFHCILVVNKTYFDDKKIYISQKQWTSIWKKCLKVDYEPIVHIIKFKADDDISLKKSICETAKYTVKDNDYIIEPGDYYKKVLPDDALNSFINYTNKLTDNSVNVLDYSLSNRRLVAFGGEFKRIHKELNLDDALDGDLINTDIENMRPDVSFVIIQYKWNVGYKNYLKAGV